MESADSPRRSSGSDDRKDVPLSKEEILKSQQSEEEETSEETTAETTENEEVSMSDFIQEMNVESQSEHCETAELSKPTGAETEPVARSSKDSPRTSEELAIAGSSGVAGTSKCESPTCPKTPREDSPITLQKLLESPPTPDSPEDAMFFLSTTNSPLKDLIAKERAVIAKNRALLKKARQSKEQEKSEEVVEFTEEKSEEVVEFTEEKSEEVVEFTEEKSEEVVEFTEEKSEEVVEFTEERSEDSSDESTESEDS